MTLDSLRCFCAVVETRNFRIAAEQVHRSQPAVSQQVKALERELGHVLLDRRRRRPTPAGQALYDRARRVLNETDSMARALREFEDGAGGELRLGASDTSTLYLLPPFVRAFTKARPRTRLVIINQPTHAIVDLLLRGDIDLGITTLPVLRDGVVEREMIRQELVLVVPRQHPASRKRRVALEELRDQRILLLDAQTRTGAILREHFSREGFDPQVAMDSGSFEVIKRYVAEGVGVSFLPRAVITAADRRLAAVAVDGLPQVRIGVIWRQGAHHTKSMAAFLHVLDVE